MKRKLLSLILLLSIITTACGKKNEGQTIPNLSEYTIEELVNHPELKDLHKLDEILNEIGYDENNDGKKEKITDLESTYNEYYNDKKNREADYAVSRIIKLLISAKISEATGLDAQSVLDNISLPTMDEILNVSGAKVNINGKSLLISAADNDQLKTLILNYTKARLASKGCNTSYGPSDRYYAAKEIVFTSEETEDNLLSDTVLITSDFDEIKIKKLSK